MDSNADRNVRHKRAMQRKKALVDARIAAATVDKGLLLVLTGTDLYQDIASDPQAQTSLETADALIVLNQLGLRALPDHLRAKASVWFRLLSSRLLKATSLWRRRRSR